MMVTATTWSPAGTGDSDGDVLMPSDPHAAIKNAVAFYAHLMDECTVDGERVTPQPGGFYGGWITRDIKGPFKGGPGTWGW